MYDFAREAAAAHVSVDRSSVQRRRERARAVLLALGPGSSRIAAATPVKVEDLSVEADVFRASFYGLFFNKYSLLETVLNPVFDIVTCARFTKQHRARRAALFGDGVRGPLLRAH